MYYYLVGIAKDKLSDSTSPTLREMMQNFLYYHWISKKSKKESAELVVQNAMTVWNKLNIETRKKDKIELKLMKEFNEWYKDLYKQQKSKTEAQKKKRTNFKEKLDEVFEVSKATSTKAVQSIEHSTADEGAPAPKKRFLGSDDLYEATSESRPRTRQSSSSSSSTTSGMSFMDLSIADLTPSDDTNDDDSQNSDDPNYEEYFVREKKKVEFIDNHVVSTIDAIGISDYKAARILTAVAQALGYELDDVTVSRTTIQRRRAENRTFIAEDIKKGYKVNLQINTKD